MKSESSKIDMSGEPSSSAVSKGKAPLLPMAAAPSASVKDHKKNGGSGSVSGTGTYKRGISVFDFLLRIGAMISALAAAAAMGTSDETLPFFTQFFQFQASYDDLPTFQFFVIAMALVSGYLVLSLPFSVITIVRPQAMAIRLMLLVLDTVALGLSTSAGSAAAAMVYLAHNGNANTNWLAICQQFGDFCQKVSGAVVASFVSVVLLVFLVVLSGFALKKH